MNNSFYNGISGVKTQQFGIDTWGNNISNINTVGFKYSNPEFASLMTSSATGPKVQGFNEVGAGVTAQATTLNMSEGSIQSTERELDLAINGKGFFGIKKGSDASINYYTRAGNFTLDANNNLVTQDGDFVLGQMSKGITINKDGSGTVTRDSVSTLITGPGAQGQLVLPKALTHPGRPGVDQVISSLPIVEVTVKRDPLTYTSAYNEKLKSLTESNDRITDPAQKLTDAQLKQQAESYAMDNAAPIAVKFPYYIPKDTVPTAHIYNEAGEEVDRIYLLSQWKGEHEYTWKAKQGLDANGKAIPDAIQDFVPDGKYHVRIDYVDQPAKNAIPVGQVMQYNIDGNGRIIASFDNGEQSDIGQIPIFHFKNEQGLAKSGGNLYTESDNSGDPMFFKTNTKPVDYYYLDTSGKKVMMNFSPGDGTYEAGSSILSNKLELSNISMAEALTQLMVTQKAFDANAKCITTSDQMIQRALALKGR